MRRDPQIGSLVRVWWVDAVSHMGWHAAEQMCREADQCESIGWLARSTRLFITVAGHRCTRSSDWNGALTIPRCAIKKIVKLPGRQG